MINEKLRIQIKTKLLKNNMTQVKLAREFGISRQQLNNVLNGLDENLRLEEKLKNWLKN